MPDITIEHVCEHPQREKISVLGKLSRRRLVYQQFVRLTDPKTGRPVEPYRCVMPRTHAGKADNGGSPWATNFDLNLMLKGIEHTCKRLHQAQPTNEYVIDFEDDATNTVLADPMANPDHVAKSLCVYRMIGKSSGCASWAFPRHEWLRSIQAFLPIWRDAADGVVTFDLDGYHWHLWDRKAYRAAMRNLAHAVVLLGLSPEECHLYRRPWFEQPSGMLQPLSADDWDAGFDICAEFGFRQFLIWHDGDEWAKPRDAKTKSLDDGIAQLSHPDIRRVFEKWSA